MIGSLGTMIILCLNRASLLMPHHQLHSLLVYNATNSYCSHSKPTVPPQNFRPSSDSTAGSKVNKPGVKPQCSPDSSTFWNLKKNSECDASVKVPLHPIENKLAQKWNYGKSEKCLFHRNYAFTWRFDSYPITLLWDPQPGSFKTRKPRITAVTSSTDIKMSNWKAA